MIGLVWMVAGAGPREDLACGATFVDFGVAYPLRFLQRAGSSVSLSRRQ
jgi:hypothetical protein